MPQALKSADKELLVDDHDDARQQQLHQSHGDVVAVKNAGSGQPHIIWPMEKYISTSRKPRDAISRRFSLGVSWSSSASRSALVELLYLLPFKLMHRNRHPAQP